jgi:hypothetical protein
MNKIKISDMDQTDEKIQMLKFEVIIQDMLFIGTCVYNCENNTVKSILHFISNYKDLEDQTMTERQLEDKYEIDIENLIIEYKTNQ